MHVCGGGSGRRGSSERFPVSTMKTMTTTRLWLASLPPQLLCRLSGSRRESDLGDRVLALKQSLEKDQGELRKYEWIETTVISYKNEEKSSTQQRCYYGADGETAESSRRQQPGRYAWRPEGQGGKAQEGGHHRVHATCGGAHPPVRSPESGDAPEHVPEWAGRCTDPRARAPQPTGFQELSASRRCARRRGESDEQQDSRPAAWRATSTSRRIP